MYTVDLAEFKPSISLIYLSTHLYKFELYVYYFNIDFKNL